MPTTRTLHRAFVGGEVSPDMYGRVDDPRYQAGAARLRNMVALPHGPAARRPGFERINAAFDSASGNNTGARLISFRFNDDQAYALEIGYETNRTGYMRIYQDGEPLTFTASDAREYIKTQDVFYIASGDQFVLKQTSTTSGSINTGAETFTAIAHGFVTGDEIGCFEVSGSLPTTSPQLNHSTTYFAIRVDDNTFKVATSLANAEAGTAINLTTANGGTIWWAKTDRLLDGERFQFDGGAPPGLSEDTSYYAYYNVGIAYYIRSRRSTSVAYDLEITGSTNAILSNGFKRYYEPGELISSGGSYYTAKTDVLSSSSFVAGTSWLAQDTDLVYTIWSPYAVADLFDVHYVQSNDIMTLVHPEYAPRELRRYGTFFWSLPVLSVASQVSPPENVTATRTLGQRQALSYATTNGSSQSWKFRNESGKPHNFVSGQSIYIWSGLDAIQTVRMHVNTISSVNSEFLLRYAETLRTYTYPSLASVTLFSVNNYLFEWDGHPFVTGDRIDVSYTNGGATVYDLTTDSGNAQLFVIVVDADSFHLATSYANAIANTPYDFSAVASARPSRAISYFTFYYEGNNPALAMGAQPVYDVSSAESSYKVTAVDAEGRESIASDAVEIVNNLAAVGAYNTLTWDAVQDATEYRVYKDQGGIYGYLGKTETTTFVDKFIGPDLGATPPLYETEFASTENYPSAVAYFEQRRVFGGTNVEPQTVWMTRSGTESDMSYHIPVLDDDRIKFQVASREANAIRHILPLNQLILLTASAEWQVRSVDNDAITPANVAVRVQSYIGASNAQPVVVNNNAVFAAARGGHLRELGYNDTAGGYITGDLSLRAAHLFDGLTIKDISYAKAPYPTIYATSSNGKLLVLTYIPEEQVAAWSWIDTDGLIESACVVPEDLEDRLYVVVNKGGTRSIQRMAEYAYSDLASCKFADDYVAFDGTVTDGTTVTVTGGSNWGYGETLTITANASQFVSGDVGDEIVLYDSDDTPYRIEITAYSSATVVSGRSKTVLPAALRSTAVSSWAFARTEYSGLDHLDGESCVILADGEVLAEQTVASGAIELATPAVKVVVGLPYTSEIYTLPMAAQVEALAQGRTKNVNKAWLRVVNSGDFEIGALGDTLGPVDVEAADASTVTGEARVTLNPSWTDGGQVHIRQTDPLPLTVVGMTLEVSVGG